MVNSWKSRMTKKRIEAATYARLLKEASQREAEAENESEDEEFDIEMAFDSVHGMLQWNNMEESEVHAEDYDSDESDEAEPSQTVLEEFRITALSDFNLVSFRGDNIPVIGNTRAAYGAGSRATSFRKQAAQREMLQIAKKNGQGMDKFFVAHKPVQPEQLLPPDPPEDHSSSDSETETIQASASRGPRGASKKLYWGEFEAKLALGKIKLQLFENPDARKEKRLKETGKNDYHRLLAVSAYLRDILGDPMTKMASSARIARALFNTKREPELLGKSHRATSIRSWADHFVLNGVLPEFRRGKQSTGSLIHDEDIQATLRQELRAKHHSAKSGAGVTSIGLVSIVKTVLSKVISLSTAQRWLKKLGWNHRTGKGMFYDGHERIDVVEYRNGFVARWALLEKHFLVYDGEVGTFSAPTSTPAVVITHDESIFRANDDRPKVWLEKGSNRCFKKNSGQSIMVSGFCCACHGWLYATEDQMPGKSEKERSGLELLVPGKNNEGWWTNAKLVEQLNRVIPVAVRLHGGMDIVFMFDNSANHHAKEPEGLDAAVFTLGGGGKNFPQEMKDGWFMLGDERVVQSMYASDPAQADGIKRTEAGKKWEKGLRAVLEERGLVAKDKTKAFALLMEQDDFKAQGSWLEEIVTKAGHKIDFYPKYHCELNFIEKMWSAAKYQLRGLCDYSFKSLQDNVPKVLKEMKVSFFAKSARSCSRYTLAYGQVDGHYLNPAQVKFAHKKYKSHRRVEESQMRQILKDFSE